MYLTINSEQRERIYRSYTSGPLSCKQLLSILENNIAPGAVRGRNELIRRLLDCHAHRNLEAHSGKETSSKDGTMHYTIYVDGVGHHMRMDQKGIVFQITDKIGDIGGIPPWVSPGSEFDPK
ncbi:hypothetical protein L0663_18515 [Dyadobacter sp. CY107]|uniref:hypothetical protein n=1 Tax=Dyadobacter fanqingshengii TaxID=2906443 RepID=UPI001F489751|nr:hypothetical protein [Dyadobacter fanqingshengii]MCF2505392.1 hypothetical protein [Dyadobacter fanqingshengii]